MNKGSKITYLNNSATSFPKPEVVAKALYDSMITLPEMTGRGEEAATAKDKVQSARERLANFLGCHLPEQLIFTSNSSDALNLAIHGFINHLNYSEPVEVITTSNDHNSVLRPLRTLQKEKRVKLRIVEMAKDGSFDLEQLFDAVSPNTRMLAINHLSNVVGTIAELDKVGSFCRDKGIVSVVDASQSAGLLDINVEKFQIDLLAITGHKYMFGPTGIGALYISPGVTLQPIKQGGTGVKSEAPFQPEEMPILFEAGTVNYHGIVALDAGLGFILEKGLKTIRSKSQHLRSLFEEKLKSVDRAILYGPRDEQERGSVASFRLDGFDVAGTDALLRSRYGIIVRSGLHCAPECHQRLGTFPDGTLRASFSYFNSEEDVDLLIGALEEITS
jgi:cysteine desulfurase/selenocysteine lyase